MASTKVKLLDNNIVLPSASVATTQGASDNTTKIATTAYVTTALANLADSAPSTLNTLNELAAALGDDANFSTTVTNSIATKAPLASPTLTGTPKINVGTNKNIIFSGGIGEIGSVPGFQGINDAGSANTDIGMRGDTIRFATGSSERARIDAEGALNFYNSSVSFNSNNKTFAHTNNFQYFLGGSNGLYLADNYDLSNAIGIRDANYIDFSTNGSERMRIDASGNVKIVDTLSVGTTSTLKGYFYESTADQNGNAKPSSVLGLAANVNTRGEGPSIDFNAVWGGAGAYQQDNWNEGWTVGRIAGVYDSAGLDTGALAFYTQTSGSSGGANSSSLTEKMRINSSGNVGIGGDPHASGRLLVTNGGTNQVVLKGASGSTNLNMGNFVGGGYISNNYYYSSGHQADDNSKGAFEVFIGDENYGINYHSAGAMGTRRRDMAITDTGKVGIGTNTPYSKLNVQGTSASTYTGSGPGATIRASQGTDGNWIASDVDGKFAYFGVDGNDAKFAAYNYTTSTEMGMVLGQSRMYIKNNGLVGIGTTSPDTQLHVKGTNNSAGDLYTAVGPGNVPSITIQNAGTTNNNNAALFFKDNDGHVASVAARFVSHTGGDEKVQLRFSVTGAGNTREKMVLTEDGHLLVGQMSSVGSGSPSYGVFGTTSGNATLTILTSSSGYGYLNFADGFSGASADPGYIRYNHNQNDLYTNRNFSGPSFSSDISRKENITDITDGWSVIKDLRPRAFDWKKDELEDAHLHGMGTGVAGFIAQELETVLPNEVHGVDGEKGIAPFGIIAYLVKTVQELEARIKDLEG